MVCYRIGHKPLSETVMTYFIAAHMGYSELIVSVGRHGAQADQRTPWSRAIASRAPF